MFGFQDKRKGVINTAGVQLDCAVPFQRKKGGNGNRIALRRIETLL